jgi:hypothetical protein
MDLAQARTTLGQHWPSVVAAVFDPQVRATPGGVQQYVWASLGNYYISRGENLPAGSFAAVNRLLSLAGQQRQAQATLSQAMLALERTGIDPMLTSAHIAPSIDSRGPGEQALGPQYRATYLSQELVDGVPHLEYRTHDLGYALPQSLTELQNRVEMAAQIEAADYGYEWGGVATPIAIQSY